MAFTPKLCPNSTCTFSNKIGGTFHRKGFFTTKRTNSRFRRYKCKSCHRYFSYRTFQPDCGHKKPDLNPRLAKVLSEGMSIRAASRYLQMTYKNTFNKFLWLSRQARLYREKLKASAQTLFVDEMETIEHTKCKPLSIVVMVNENMEILEAKVAIMPAKGPLANFSVKKYGKRIDEREKILEDSFKEIKTRIFTAPKKVLSDAKLSYKKLVAEYFPEAAHEVHNRSQKEKDRRRNRMHEFEGKRAYDPMFCLNQRCAKLRSDIKRLVRRSWCTTKKPANLQGHLDIYLMQQSLAKKVA